MSEEVVIKMILLGDTDVGKSNLALKYIKDEFHEDFLGTIGIEFMETIVEINKTKIKIQIHDTAGQERFRAIAKSFIKDADGILFVFDITNKSSFQGLKHWISDSNDNAKSTCKKVILSNKIDLEKDRKVPVEMFKKFCENEKIKGFETSAKTGQGVKQAFEELAKLIIGQKNQQEIKREFTRKTMVIDKNKTVDNTLFCT